MKINAIITGATGMVGRAILLECLQEEKVEKVLVVGRKTTGLVHAKLKEILVADLNDIASLENQLSGYNACFYSMGISSMGLTEEQYSRITYDITFRFASVLKKLNPDLVFNYVSGQGTDSSEKGPVMWARVKGRTENMILQTGFRDAYMFRPGIILPEKGVKSATALYNVFYVVFRPLFPLFRRMDSVTTSSRVGKAMINSVLYPQTLKHLENRDINLLA